PRPILLETPDTSHRSNSGFCPFFFNDTATTEIYTTRHTLSLHDALPISVIESGAVIGPRVQIGPLAFVGAGAQVGEASVVHARVALCAGVRLGKRVVVHPGAVIGADGFGYVFDGQAHRKIPQVGSVLIEDDVEIGANTTIDRATLGQTIVRRGTKLDNLVQVGHNVEIGAHSIIVAQVGI